ncbi:hypothetical protein L209DRAFT_755365 [Thermothelomyces heterothallicus CBS 203.75]
MKANKTRRPRLLLFAGLSLLLGNAATAQSTCYNTRGEEDPNLQPCSAPGADAGGATWCCARGDTCLSNGLCLSPGSSNLMTQQGCTDKDWGGSCKKYCPAGDDQKLTEIPLVPCPASFNSDTNDVKFCCGPDPSSCCEKSASWISLPAGTIVPSQANDDSTSSSSSSDPDNARYSLKIGLGIGLGLGVPILLVLLAVAYLLAQPLHSRSGGRHGSGRRKGGGGRSGDWDGDDVGDGTNTEKTSDTSHTYPPRSYFARTAGGGGGGGGGGARTQTRPRRQSFGNYTHVRGGSASSSSSASPAADDEANHHGGRDDQHTHHAIALWSPHLHHHHHHHHHGTGGVQSARSVATALAQWARSPFGFGGLEPPLPGPESPREMDGSGSGRSARAHGGSGSGSGSGSGRGETTPSRLGAAELPSPDLCRLEEGGGGAEGGGHGPAPAASSPSSASAPGGGGGGSSASGGASGQAAWHAGRRVHVAAEGVELPTPGTPVRPYKDVEMELGVKK